MTLPLIVDIDHVLRHSAHSFLQVHAVTADFTPDMRLKPVNPGATHINHFTGKFRSECPTTQPVAGLKKGNLVTAPVQFSGRRTARKAPANDNDVPLTFAAVLRRRNHAASYGSRRG